MEIINVTNLSVKYDKYRVLENVTLSVSQGDYVALAGPNGAGKTTLIKAVVGLVEKESGFIRVETDKIGYLQQKVALKDYNFPAAVKEIVKSGLINKKEKQEHKVRETMELLGISELSDKLIGKLSGGQLQKVLLARALVSGPDVLFLDEPTTALDPVSRDGFYKTIKELNEKYGITIILVSHDVGSVGKYAGKMAYIDRKLIFYGTFEQFCYSKDMTAYFGDISQHFFCQRH